MPKAKNPIQAKALANKGYFRPSVVADKIGVNRTTIYRWIKDAKIEAITFNGNYFIAWDSVEKFLGALGDVLDLKEPISGEESRIAAG